MNKSITLAKSIIGEVIAPPSKAHTLRAIFIASLAEGKSILHNCLIAEDQEYAIKAMQMLGAKIDYDKEKKIIEIEGINGKLSVPKENIFIGNSGVTVRLLVSIAALTENKNEENVGENNPGKEESNGKEIIIDGVERMRNGRPLQDLLDALKELGVKTESINGNGCPPIKVKPGTFNGGITHLAGEKSSQYFSSIFIASPYAKNNVEINTIGELSSKPYIDLTFDVMKEFGVIGENENYNKFVVDNNQKYKGREFEIEGDYSNAAYFFAAAAIGKGKVRVNKINIDSKQGDKFFLEALEKMGCAIGYIKNDKGDSIIVEGKNIKGLGEVDMNNYPDIVMPLAVVAAFAEGETKFTNIEHLRIKESDRLEVMIEELSKMDVDVEGDKDSLTIRGSKEKMKGAVISSHNDHRIAMSFAVAGLFVEGIEIEGEEAVGKSFPDFFEELEKIVER